MSIQSRVGEVTDRVIRRSKDGRLRYLDRIKAAQDGRTRRSRLSCGNLAHGFAACNAPDKAALAGDAKPNLGIITAYNDMLSAHQPYERFPEIIREAARAAGGVA
jgi:phosphogluconate dehydratase